MLAYLILGIVILFCIYVLARWFMEASPKDVLRILKWIVFFFLLLTIVWLALSGRLGLAFAALPAALIWFNRFRTLLNIGKAANTMFGKKKQAPPQTYQGPMGREEALAVLGLKEGALPAEIKAAYQRLISQAHPDKGGSDYLAAKINQAKDILLND